jgi:hypothetical protein
MRGWREAKTRKNPALTSRVGSSNQPGCRSAAGRSQTWATACTQEERREKKKAISNMGRKHVIFPRLGRRGGSTYAAFGKVIEDVVHRAGVKRQTPASHHGREVQHPLARWAQNKEDDENENKKTRKQENKKKKIKEEGKNKKEK